MKTFFRHGFILVFLFVINPFLLLMVWAGKSLKGIGVDWHNRIIFMMQDWDEINQK